MEPRLVAASRPLRLCSHCHWSACQIKMHWSAHEKSPVRYSPSVGAFQDVTLRLIADHLLLNSRESRLNRRSRSKTQRKTYVQGELVNTGACELPEVSKGRCHIYCSRQNPGGKELIMEVCAKNSYQLQVHEELPAFAGRHQWTLEVSLTDGVSWRRKGKRSSLHMTEDPADLTLCDHMLVYLNGQTWSRGEVSDAFADEVERAMDAGIHLMLAHETPGIGGQRLRHAVEFGEFFSRTATSTPERLLLRGIYNEIAVALKGACRTRERCTDTLPPCAEACACWLARGRSTGGAWREVSMVLLANALASMAVPENAIDHAAVVWIKQFARGPGSARLSRGDSRPRLAQSFLRNSLLSMGEHGSHRSDLGAEGSAPKTSAWPRWHEKRPAAQPQASNPANGASARPRKKQRPKRDYGETWWTECTRPRGHREDDANEPRTGTEPAVEPPTAIEEDSIERPPYGNTYREAESALGPASAATDEIYCALSDESDYDEGASTTVLAKRQPTTRRAPISPAEGNGRARGTSDTADARTAAAAGDASARVSRSSGVAPGGAPSCADAPPALSEMQRRRAERVGRARNLSTDTQ
jgi:hypothetical protein